MYAKTPDALRVFFSIACESDLVYTSFKSVEEALPNFMHIFDAKEIKYFLKCLSEFKNDRHNQSACCNYKVEYIKNSNI